MPPRLLTIACLLARGLVADSPDAGPSQDPAGDAADIAAVTADLRTLCEAIGPRMAGTVGMREALDWARRSFAAAGLANVRLESVPMPLRWQEGATRIEIVAPDRFLVRAAASALSPAVETAFEADLLDGGSGAHREIAGQAGRYRGAAVLVELDQAGSFDALAVEQRDAMVAVREAAAAGARAVLLVSTRPGRLLYRHVNNVKGQLDPIPSALVTREDGSRLLELLRSGQRVRIRFEMPNRIGGPYETANVLAEIPGAERPGEIVLLGAHLDSWDMGAGCLDNAVNVALVMHVARSLGSAGSRPKRTLRFVLFGGEEFGLLGSLAYIDRHGAELDRHVAVIVHDMGGGPVIGYSVGGRPELLPRLRAALGSWRGRELRHTLEAYFLSDNFPFVLQGVPALFAVQDTAGFHATYHSEADVLGAVRIDPVGEAAAIATAAVRGIADLDLRFGKRLPEDAVLAWVRGAGLVRHLQFLGVWEAWRRQPSDGR